MNIDRFSKWLCLLFGLMGMAALSRPTFAAESARIDVQVNKPGHRVPSSLWGIFFEDINCSVDGGIYAEMVRNRSLEDSDKPEFWTLVKSGSGKGAIAVSLEKPMNGDLLSNRNRRSLHLEVTEASDTDPVGVANEGYWGMALQRGAEYELSLYARAAENFRGPVNVELQKADGTVCGRGQVSGLQNEWKQFHVALKSDVTEPKARLVLSVTSPCSVWFDMVSLFPKQTWRNRGLRPDLMDKLAGLTPSFVRFPGGCWVEGDTMKYAYRWKDTVGPLSERRTQYNIWQYKATHGVGFHEYLQMCEDLGAEPLFVINCGMSHKENIPLDEMGPFVQDALDAIEYCNGPVTSPYGALRAKNGHPAPFNLKYMEIGNENGGPAYHERWALFHDAIKEKYPDIHLVANVWDGYPENITPRIVDEHYYSTAEFFIQQAGKYDSYDRNGPKIYIGEYAVTQGCGQGNLRAAIGEAAFMTGIERNSDVVMMASYAPLFANVDYKKWNPDLICYDSARSYGLPSYYVQQLFSENRGDVVLPVTATSPEVVGQPLGGTIGVGTWATTAEFKDMKVTHDSETLYDFAKSTNGWKFLEGDWSLHDGVLRQSSPNENVRALLPGRNWTDYTYQLKARKLSGNEGFLILFNVADEAAKSWWNVGGWGNDHHALEVGGMTGQETKGRIETNRWYDIRIEMNGHAAKCYLDGKLINEGNAPMMRSLYASATRDEAKQEVILKVVNVSDQPLETEVKLNGASRVSGQAEATVLTSGSPEDENTLENPTRVHPTTSRIELAGTNLRHTFPAKSLTVLRLKTQ